MIDSDEEEPKFGPPGGGFESSAKPIFQHLGALAVGLLVLALFTMQFCSPEK